MRTAMGIAMYLRLSVEDSAGGKDESNSISNQRRMIRGYLSADTELSEGNIHEFCDDGYSGTSMERPGMQKLLAAVRGNQVQCVIVKDMSRFSRDYIELGTYLNQIFPFMGIRFIAINDHYDSRRHGGSTIAIDTAFQSLVYDLYSKDMSIKMKAAFRNKCDRGEYVFGQVPLGYEKSSAVKNAVVVNEKEAEIVRFIFSLAAEGKGCAEIAKILYAEGIPTTTQLRYPQRKLKKEKVAWSDGMIRKLLENRFYLGEMDYGKSVRKYVGSKQGIPVPKEDWKVIPNHHEPLVTPEIFALVAPGRTGNPTGRKRQKYPLVGKVFCGGCGYSMSYKVPSGREQFRHFWCRKHSVLQIPHCCTYFNTAMLEEMVLFMLTGELLKRGSVELQREELERLQKGNLESLKGKTFNCRKWQREIQREKNDLYEKYAAKRITREEYRKRVDDLGERLLVLEQESKKLEEAYAGAWDGYRAKKENMRQIIGYSHLEELTQGAVDVFIKKIYLYKDKRVEIEWNFAEEIFAEHT